MKNIIKNTLNFFKNELFNPLEEYNQAAQDYYNKHYVKICHDVEELGYKRMAPSRILKSMYDAKREGEDKIIAIPNKLAELHDREIHIKEGLNLENDPITQIEYIEDYYIKRIENKTQIIMETQVDDTNTHTQGYDHPIEVVMLAEQLYVQDKHNKGYEPRNEGMARVALTEAYTFWEVVNTHTKKELVKGKE